MELILASGSPRRREIMERMGLSFHTEVCPDPERTKTGLSPEETVMQLARQKAQYVLSLHPDGCVIGADTIVYLDGEILGKPKTAEDAVRMLERLQGRRHTVFTGLAVLKRGYADVRCCGTNVLFRPMTEREIAWYVSTGDPLDKAGAYGIQGIGSVFVDSIEGNYFNVVGLPAPILYEMLLKAEAVTEDRK